MRARQRDSNIRLQNARGFRGILCFEFPRWNELDEPVFFAESIAYRLRRRRWSRFYLVGDRSRAENDVAEAQRCRRDDRMEPIWISELR